MELSIKLEAKDFSTRTPTKTQIENMCGEMSEFLQRVGGSVLATGEFNIKEGWVQHIFNAAGALMAAKEACGANSSNIAVPRPQPVPAR